MSFLSHPFNILHFSEDLILFLQENPHARYALVAVTLLLILFLTLRLVAPKNAESDEAFTARDFDRIAGEDIPSTQLDLAKAYIEMDQKKQAKNILKQVIRQAEGQLKQDAKQLMKTL